MSAHPTGQNSPPPSSPESADGDVYSLGEAPPAPIARGNPQVNLLVSPISELGGNDSPHIWPSTQHVTPYAVLRFPLQGGSQFRDLVEARHLERQLESAVLSRLYSVVSSPAGNPDVLTPISDEVEVEIQEAEAIIAAVSSLVELYEGIAAAFDQVIQYTNVTALVVKNIELLGVDPLNAQHVDSIVDYRRVLIDASGIGQSMINQYSTTAMYAQSLIEMDFTLNSGISPGFLLSNMNHRGARQPESPGTGYRQYYTVLPAWEGPYGTGLESTAFGAPGVKYFLPHFKSLTSMVSSAGPIDWLYASSPWSTEWHSYIPLADGGFTPLTRTAYHCAVLSREMLISAGMARLAGTPLGRKYGAESTDAIDRLLSVRGRSNVTSGRSNTVEHHRVESSTEGLGALAVVRHDAGLGGRELDTVLPFEISTPAGTPFEGAGNFQPRSTARGTFRHGSPDTHGLGPGRYPGWIDSIKHDPFNNRMGELDEYLGIVDGRFAEAEEYLKTLLSRRDRRWLTTPRGLYTRILKAFVGLMEGLSSDPLSMPVVTDLLLLQTAGKHEPDAQLAEAHRVLLHDTDPRDVPVTPVGACSLLRHRLLYKLAEHAMAQQEMTALEAAGDDMAAIWAAGTNRDPAQRMRMRISMLDDEGREAYAHGAAPGEPYQSRKRDVSDFFDRAVMTALIATKNGTYPPTDADVHIVVDFNVQAMLARFAARDNPAMAAMTQIFNELVSEAEQLAATDGAGGSILSNPQRTTLNSGFDGARILSMILDCFIDLAQCFVNIQFFTPVTADAGFDRLDNVDVTKHLVIKRAGTGVHYQNNRTNLLRMFLQRLTAASEAGDLSGLVDGAGNLTMIPRFQDDAYGLSVLEDTRRLDPVTSYSVTAEKLIESVKQLAHEDGVPTSMFALAKSLPENLSVQCAPLSSKAAELRNADSSDSPDVVIYRKMRDSDAETGFLKAMSREQLSAAKRRLAMIKNAHPESRAINGPSDGLFKAYRLLLAANASTPVEWEGEAGSQRAVSFQDQGAVFFLGLPAGSITDHIAASAYDDAASPGRIRRADSLLKFSVVKTSAELPNFVFEPKSWEFPLVCDTTAELIEEAFLREPVIETLRDLVFAVRFNFRDNPQPRTGRQITEDAAHPTFTEIQLTNQLESFLWKNMCQEVTGFTFLDEMIVKSRAGGSQSIIALEDDRSAILRPLAHELAKPMGLSVAIINAFFPIVPDLEDAMSMPSPEQLDRLIEPQPIIVSGSAAYAVPSITPSQAAVISSFFSTKPFFVKRVKRVVFSTSVFDKTVAILVAPERFGVNHQATDNNEANAVVLNEAQPGSADTPGTESRSTPGSDIVHSQRSWYVGDSTLIQPVRLTSLYVGCKLLGMP